MLPHRETDLEYLEKLRDHAHHLMVTGAITAEDLGALHTEEPDSHVFMGEDLPDLEEDLEVMKMIGDRDIGDKIRYWEEALRDIDEAPVVNRVNRGAY